MAGVLGALSGLLASAAGAERLAVLSDLNGSYGSTVYHRRVDVAVARVLELRPDAVVIAGDMVAGQRERPLARTDLIAMWREFHRVVTDPLGKRGVPVFAAPGNHDASAYPGFETERAVYAEQWRERLRGVATLDAQGLPYYFAGAVGEVLLIVLDATLPGPLPSEQHAFLEQMLRREAGSFRWCVVVSHLPLWPFSRGREEEILVDSRLEEQLRRFAAVVFVSGHHHAFWAGKSADGVVHVSNGSLGGSVRPLVGERRTRPFSFTVIDLPRSGEPRVTALRAPDFDSALPLATLPERIERPDGALTRLDAGVRAGEASAMGADPPGSPAAAGP